MTSKTRKTDHRSQSAVKYVKKLIQTKRKRERERERAGRERKRESADRDRRETYVLIYLWSISYYQEAFFNFKRYFSMS